MKIIIAISGASGASLGLKTLKALPENVQKHLIVSEHAKEVFAHEEHVTIHDDADIAAPLASGSFGADAMMIIPCSMNTLAKTACGIADNLTTRAASVMIKEHKTLLLAPREMPFSAIALENMLKLSRLGVVIAPPVMAYYSRQDSLDAMETFMIGKWFDLIGIENDLYKRWGSDD
ncbi:MAG: UbiX family flavin prenyltransferase [Campylobacterales bacterium]